MRYLLSFILFPFFVLPLAQAQNEVEEHRPHWYISIPFTYLLDREMQFEVSNSTVNRSGNSFLDDETDSTPVRFIVGRQFNSFRMEGEVFSVPYNIADVDYANINFPREILDRFDDYDDIVQSSGGTEYKGAAFSVFYDFINKTNWTPYMGVGIGVAKIEVDTAINILNNIRYGGGADIVEMFHIEYGMDYELYEWVDIFINYRSTLWGDVFIDDYSSQSNGNSALNLDSSTASTWALGLRFRLKRNR